jgi:hypothetical protein
MDDSFAALEADWGAEGPAVIRIDPDAPTYRPAAADGVPVEEIAPGLWVIG